MITYNYVTTLTPAAPFVTADLSSLDGQMVVTGLTVQVDSAADRTVVPAAAVTRLGATAIEERMFGGFDGSVLTLPIYRIFVTIHGVPSPFLADVVASSHKPWMLLGRDILNQIRTVLDGPRLKLDIG